MLVDAQSSPLGIPALFIQQKRDEILLREQQQKAIVPLPSKPSVPIPASMPVQVDNRTAAAVDQNVKDELNVTMPPSDKRAASSGTSTLNVEDSRPTGERRPRDDSRDRRRRSSDRRRAREDSPDRRRRARENSPDRRRRNDGGKATDDATHLNKHDESDGPEQAASADSIHRKRLKSGRIVQVSSADDGDASPPRSRTVTKHSRLVERDTSTEESALIKPIAASDELDDALSGEENLLEREHRLRELVLKSLLHKKRGKKSED